MWLSSGTNCMSEGAARGEMNSVSNWGRRLKKKYSVDLADHMAECEANYARVMQLLPNLVTADDWEFGLAVPGSSPVRLRITITERCKYTTMLEIEQHDCAGSALPGNLSSTPCFSLRVYHDARMAEVVGFNSHRQIRPRYDYPNDKMYHRDEKAQLNRFLGEWLSHCLKYGHALDNPLARSVSRV